MTVINATRTIISLPGIQLIMTIQLKPTQIRTQNLQPSQIKLPVFYYSNYQFQQQKIMTIRHKVNIAQKINDFEVVLSKYSSRTNENKQIGQIVPNSKRSQNINMPLQLNKGVRNANIKEDSIKMIDEKINIILKKHRNVGDFQRTPLAPRNNVAILAHKKQASLYEFQGKEGQDKHPSFSSSKKQPSEKANEAIKQECKRLRERSNKIFQNGDLTDRYQSIHQPQQLSKYDKQIKKLNERIKKAEQQKKKLNIEFSPFVASAKSKVRLDNFSKSNEKPLFTATPAKVEEVKIRKQSISEFIVEEIAVTTPVKVEKKCGIVKNKIVPPLHTNNTTLNAVAQLVQKQIVALLPAKKQKSKQTINQFVSVLCQQIILDEQLRNKKIWFTFSNEDNKWQILQEKLNENGETVPSNQIRSIFQSTVQQHNPFYRWGNVNFNDGITSLISSYKACKDHWQTTVANKWSHQLFQNQSLKDLLLFQQRNNSFTLQDLVRFLNTQTGNFYRNRDLHLIFKRLTPNPHLEYSEFISSITL